MAGDGSTVIQKSYQEQFTQEGYIVIPKLITGDELLRIRDISNRALAKFYEDLDIQNPGRDPIRLDNFMNPKWYDNEEDLRLIMELGADPRCLGPVEQIFRGRSLYKTSIFWMNPRYSSMEGNWHRDTQFVYKEEAEKEYVASLRENDGVRGVQFQIALVDSSDFEYIPFSVQRFDSPEEYYYRLADHCSHSRSAEGMPNAVRIHLKAGDAILLNQVGIHRGRYHMDKLRRTLMFSYTPANNPTFSHPKHVNDQWKSEHYLDQLSSRAAAYYKEYIKVYQEYEASQQKPDASANIY
ncbi:MAG: Phytanoyl-CoA dioxygenase [Paenibacillaceae bacterium]|jgi:hypothetical protein|nr:Phytanoyl-CoA dioxygenase [Paenibacillaceae bacterium]